MTLSTTTHRLDGTPEGTWGNTILFRLAQALGYPTAPTGEAVINPVVTIIADPDELLAEALEQITRAGDLETRLSHYLDNSTGGLLSKTGYDVPTMIQHTDEHYAKLHAEESPQAYREIRARISQEDVPIHVAADIEQIICETGGDFGEEV